MRSLQATLFVLVMLVLSTQSFRHVYVKWVEPTGSVLDEFRETVDEDIAASKSLDELKAMYAKARTGRQDFEKDKPLRDVDLAKRTNREVYRSEQELREAIVRVEGQERDLTRLWFYWLCGLLSVVLGLLAYARVNPWVGMVGLITGFVEMAVWTSPLWRSHGPQGSFDRPADAEARPVVRLDGPAPRSLALRPASVRVRADAGVRDPVGPAPDRPLPFPGRNDGRASTGHRTSAYDATG